MKPDLKSDFQFLLNLAQFCEHTNFIVLKDAKTAPPISLLIRRKNCMYSSRVAVPTRLSNSLYT